MDIGIMAKRKRICIYCASSKDIRPEFYSEARALGFLLAQHGMEGICGAGREGLMGAITDSMLESGGKMTGVIPQFMVERGWNHPNLSKTIVTADIHHRKRTMATLSDAVIALPGGCGTMEELLEIITWKQLGLYNNPIIILNTRNYYDPLLDMLFQAVDERFMKKSHQGLWHVAQTAEEALDLLETLPVEAPAESKYTE